LTLHGEVHGPYRDVSLLECFTIAYRDGGQRLEGGYALVGGHVSTDARFSSAHFRLRHLDDWAQLPGLSRTDSADRKAIVWERPEPLRIELPTLGCQLELAADVPTPKLDLRGARLQHTAKLHLTDLSDVPLRDIWWVVGALYYLLTLAVDADCRPTHLEVLDSASGAWLDVVDSRLDPGAAGDIQRPHYLLLTREHMGLQALATWIGRYDERLRPIPGIVAGAVGTKHHVLESELFELASAAEGLHRRFDKTEKTSAFTKAEAKAVREAARKAAGDNEELANRVQVALVHIRDVSYTERLTALLAMASTAMSALTEWDLDEWKKRILSARDGVAHQLPSYRNAEWEDRWRQELALSYSLRWLLVTLLLLETGVEPAVLASRLSQHVRFNSFRQQARDWLPTVFHPADGL
jgi:hypothetical protein